MEQFFIVGSGIALLAAAAFLGIAIAATLKIGKANAFHTYIFFAVSMLLLALYLFLWHIAFGRVGQEAAPTSATTSQNLTPLWLSGVGTTLLAVMTFIMSVVIPWWRRPKLVITYVQNTGPFHRLASEPLDSLWLRVKVTNVGKTVAKNCVGRLVEFKDSSGKPIDHDPVRLHWIDTLWAPLELLSPIDLSREDSGLLDVVITKKDSKKEAFLFTNALIVAADQSRHERVASELVWSKLEKLPCGAEGRIKLAVYAENTKPCSKEYSISWEGKDYTDIRLDPCHTNRAKGGRIKQ